MGQLQLRIPLVWVCNTGTRWSPNGKYAHGLKKWRDRSEAVRCSSTEPATQNDRFTTHAPPRTSSNNPTRRTKTLTKPNGYGESQKHKMELQLVPLGTNRKNKPRGTKISRYASSTESKQHEVEPKASSQHNSSNPFSEMPHAMHNLSRIVITQHTIWFRPRH